MSVPSTIRSTAGFRSCTIFELSASGSWLGLPLGATTQEVVTPYTVSGSVISGSTVALPAGTAVSGSVPYYGLTLSGAKVLTINDPAPRVMPHIGEDGVFSLQVLPPTEAVTGELRSDKTNDVVDAVVSGVNKVTLGEAQIMGQATNKRGFESQVGIIAYAAGQDTSPDSTTFGAGNWDFRIIPKSILYQRDTGYQAEVNERMYSVTPMFVTAHLWGVQFVTGTEGYTRTQLIRGVSQYKPVIVGYKGDATTVCFPFDSAKPAASIAKIVVWKNGALLSTGYTPHVSGLVFGTAPAATDIITCFYEVV